MQIARSRILLWSGLSGVLWAMAWPGIGGLAPLALIAWLPLLHARRSHRTVASGRGSFLPYVLLATFIWNASCAWWFYCVSEPIGTRLISGTAPILVNTLLMALPWTMADLVRRRFGERAATLGLIALWLAFERLHHDWDLQWPWFSIGNVFAEHPGLIQWYDHTGMLGGTLWVLAVNLLLDRMFVHGRLHGVSFSTALVPLCVIIIPCSLSAWRFHHHVEEGHPVEVVVVQPNIDPYDEKFGGIDAMEQLDRMLALADSAMGPTTEAVIMPETALQEGATVDMATGRPVYRGLWENWIDRSQSVEHLQRFRSSHPGTAILVGMSSDSLYTDRDLAPAIARPLFRDLPPDRAMDQRWYVPFNAALFLPAHGAIHTYHKSKLVAGVEALPFESLLGPIAAFTVDLGGTTGSLGGQEERSVLRDPSSRLAIAPAICYESVFGEHVAAHVRNGANLIAIMTNDGWWGDSPGHVQHLSFASIRAIETRRAVARSANTGISCFVDQRGVIRDRTEWWRMDARRSTVLLNDELTFYVRHGDLIGRAAVAIAAALLLGLVIAICARRRTRGSGSASS